MNQTVVLAAIVGGLVGCGALMVWFGLTRPVGSLVSIANSLDDPDLQRRSGVMRGGLQDLARSSRRRWARELELCEESSDRFISGRMLLAIEFAALPLVAWLGSVLGLIPRLAGGPTLVLLSLIGAAVGWMLAALQLRREAAKRQTEFSNALAMYTDLVGILISGGAGIEAATTAAASVGDGPAFRHIRTAIDGAGARREPPWGSFRRLGERLEIEDLIDFGASVELAAEGSRLVEALQAKVDVIRERDINRELADAESRSEAMVLPITIMLGGVFVLIGYPILVALSRL